MGQTKNAQMENYKKLERLRIQKQNNISHIKLCKFRYFYLRYPWDILKLNLRREGGTIRKPIFR